MSLVSPSTWEKERDDKNDNTYEASVVKYHSESELLLLEQVFLVLDVRQDLLEVKGGVPVGTMRSDRSRRLLTGSCLLCDRQNFCSLQRTLPR